MRPELETYEQIDSFLNGELKGEELNSFQKRMQIDVEFAEEVQLQKIANALVVGASFQDLRDQMSTDISKMDSSSNSNKWKFISIGLAFIAFSSAVLYFYPFTETKKDDQTSSDNKQRTSIQKIEGVRAVEKIKLDNLRADNKEINEQIVSNQFKQTDSTFIHQSDVANRLKDTISSFPIKQVDAKQIKDTATSVQNFNIEQIKPVSNPCSGVDIEAIILTGASCADRSTGSINVVQTDIKGGTAPYNVRLDKSRTAVNNIFTNLPANTYSVSITDKAGCMKVYAVEIEEQPCNPKSAVFTPDKGEVWKFEGLNNLTYTLTIINIAGQQVFKTAQIQGVFEWQGYSQKGEYLDAGLYIYVAEYSDGSKVNGQVTIAK